ncbi:MAG: DNA polymerase III subunit delta [Parasporobacterium sp.]|nr:DNA polymerase III subunit delta [Parasporobacterium sp.]
MASIGTDLKNGHIANLYLFYGEEAFKKRHYKELLKTAVTGGDTFNLSVFEGKDIDWQAVYDTSQTLPFFAQKRLVIVENSGKFKAAKSSGSGNRDPGSGTKEAGAKQTAAGGPGAADSGLKESGSSGLLEKILENIPETCCLAFFEESAAKNKRIYKTIASKGVVCECTADSEETLINWLARGFAREKRKVRRSTLELLIDRVGFDYDLLRMEFEKIISYAGNREVIEDRDVLAITTQITESRIFDMLTAISEKNVRKVLEKYHDLLANKEPALYILAMLRSQFRIMLQIAELADAHLNSFEIAKAVGRPKFAVDRIRGCLRYFTNAQIEQILIEIAETDRKCKSGEIQDQIGVELMLIRFSG